ncbi:MAG: hypothetical protein ACLVJH_06170 [Faecalibacterium prausnitzii]
MKNMNCVSTMPEIMPEITDEAIIEALFAQRPYEEKVINSAFLEIPAEYQRKLNIPNVEKDVGRVHRADCQPAQSQLPGRSLLRL